MKTTKNGTLHVVVVLYLLVGILSCQKELGASALTAADKQAIEALARDVPLILAEQGWDAYVNTFSEDYRNWSMVGDQVRSRAEYLALVKDWYDQGNRATESTIKTIDFVPLSANNVMYLYALQERFNDPEDATKTVTRDIRFVATYRRTDGTWENTFTAFMDLPPE